MAGTGARRRIRGGGDEPWHWHILYMIVMVLWLLRTIEPWSLAGSCERAMGARAVEARRHIVRLVA